MFRQWEQWIRRQARFIALLYDISMVPLAWFGAHCLRFNFEPIPPDAMALAMELVFLVGLAQFLSYPLVGLHRGIWRFASLPDLLRIFQSAALGSALFLCLAFLCHRLAGLPRSIVPLYALLLIFLLGGARFLVRYLKSKTIFGDATVQRVLIVGAGEAGESVIRDLLRGWAKQYRPVAIVDDRKNKRGQELHGIRVLGTCDEIPEIVQRHQVDLIIIAMPSATGRTMRRLMRACEKTRCVVRILPGFSDVVAGRLAVDSLREIALEDLLGRAPVVLDKQGISQGIRDRVVLVSGGGGSIGAELCRQVAVYQPKTLIVVDQSEYALFCIQQELQSRFPHLPILIRLLNVGDAVGVEALFRSHRPDVVLHAAAYKHVPMLEDQSRQAIANNVLGTYVLAKAAVFHQVDKFLLVSTDKAVHPTNVMGASKRASELICQAFQQEGRTRFVTVRFGNVLESAGSVIPTFRRQIEMGGPVTVTHPEITRFFMTIPEAVQLILQALALGEGGELFVLDMGDPVKIQFLAEQMIRLAGKKLGEDIDIQHIGLRPGEKLNEELFYQKEMQIPTQHEKIFRALSDSVSAEHIFKQVQGLASLCQTVDSVDAEASLIQALQTLVPELKMTSSEALA